MASIDEFQEQLAVRVPSLSPLEKHSMPNFIIIGKSGSGKTSLAKRLASELGCKLVNAATLSSPTLSTSEKGAEEAGEPKQENEYDKYLNEGKEVPTNMYLAAINNEAHTDRNKFTGIVLDDVVAPFPTKNRDGEVTNGLEQKTIDPPTTDLGLVKALTNVSVAEHNERAKSSRFYTASEEVPDFCPVIINLTLSENSFKRRRTSQRVDPINGNLYSGAQIKFTTFVPEEAINLSEALEDGEEEQIEEEEEAADGEDGDPDDEDAAPKIVKPERFENPIDEINYDEQDFKDAEKSKKKNLERRVKLSNKRTWEKVPEQVLPRLLTRPEDMDNNVEKEESYWKESVQPFLSDLEARSKMQMKNPFHFFNVDGSQHPDTIFTDVMTRIESIGKGKTIKAILPKVLAPIQGARDDEIIQQYKEAELGPDEPSRELGPWNIFCPVALVLNKQMEKANLANAVAYRDEEFMRNFQDNPDKFLQCPVQLPKLRLSVVGGPFTGKTTQAKLLSHAFKLRYINPQETLDNWSNNADQKTLLDTVPLYRRIVRRCLVGKAITASMIVDIIKYELEEHTFDMSATEQCWVLDGVPQTMEQAEALISAGIVPDYLVQMDSARSKNFMVDSNTGKASSNSQGSDIEMAPFVEKMFEGYMAESAAVSELIKTSGGSVVSIDSIYGIETALSVIQTAVNPFFPRAVPLSPASVSALGPDIEQGYTKDYCPVTLKKTGILLKGTTSHSAIYMVYSLSSYIKSRLYCFASEEAKNSFITEPQTFLNSTNFIPRPPARLGILGPTDSGKSTQAKILSERSGVPHVDFESMLRDYIKALPDQQREEVETSISESGQFPSDIIAEAAKSLFTEHPWSTEGFIAENFPYNRSNAEFLVGEKLYCDAIIHLKSDAEALSVRANRSRQLMNAEENLKRAVPLTEEEIKAEQDAITEKIEKLINQSAEVANLIESISSIPVIEINANRFSRPIASELQKKTSKFLEQVFLPATNHVQRDSLFSSAHSILEKTADDLLALGRLQYSNFKKYCPVTVAKTPYLRHDALGKIPVAHNGKLYYLKSEATMSEFLANTFNYVETPGKTPKTMLESSFLPKVKVSAPKPLIPASLFVLGPPKSGKTIVSKRISYSLDLVYLTVPIILEAILEGKEDTLLHDTIKKSLDSGDEVSDDCVNEAIKLITSRAICQSKGYCLDGYPLTKVQAQALEKLDVIPQNIIELEVDETKTLERCEINYLESLASKIPDLNSPDIIKRFNDIYAENLQDLKTMYGTGYNIWSNIDQGNSKWMTAELAEKTVATSTQRRQYYLDLKQRGRAAPIYGVGLRISDIEAASSPFGDYCPVTLLEEEKLVHGVGGTIHTVEYKNLFYNMADKETMDQFLDYPEKYVALKELPPLPRMLQENELPVSIDNLELKGYCPVTLHDGPPGIIHGDKDIAAEYLEMFFVFVDKEKADRFMKTPWKFMDQILPDELPPVKVNIPLKNLPIVGYLEETLSSKINDGLRELSKYKPKYPYKNLRSNPYSKDWLRKSYRGKLDKFKDDCEIIGELSAYMEQRMYIPPQEREPWFESKMQYFLSL